MSLAYPVAASVESALSGAGDTARTRFEAETLAGDQAIKGLVTDWFTPPKESREDLLAQAAKGQELGFVQQYEDRNADPVLAVTYWKLAVRPLKPPAPDPMQPRGPETDHTDDLYFKHGRTKKRRNRRKTPDPNQMDLFSAPAQKDD